MGSIRSRRRTSGQFLTVRQKGAGAVASESRRRRRHRRPPPLRQAGAHAGYVTRVPLTTAKAVSTCGSARPAARMCSTAMPRAVSAGWSAHPRVAPRPARARVRSDPRWPGCRGRWSGSLARGQLGASVVRAIRKRRGSSVGTVMYGRESDVVEGAGALECPAPLLPRLRLLPLPLDRRLLVVGAPFHLLKEAVLLHQLLERLQRGLDLVVDDLDPHSAAPEVRGRSIAAHRLGATNDVHLHEPLRPLRYGAGDRRKGLVRLLDDLARVVDDAPTPVSMHRG